MTPVVAFVALTLAAGVPASLLFDDEQDSFSILGSGFLLGMAAHVAILFTMSLIGIHWSRAGLIGTALILALVLWTVVLKRCRLPRASRVWSPVGGTIDLLTLLTVAGHARFATLAPLPESDFMTIWGLKAKTFWIAGGIDFEFLTSPWSALFHVDYPLLLPLSYDALSIVADRWDDRIVGIHTTLFGVAVLLIVRGTFETELERPTVAAIGALAMAPLVLSPWIGLAEGPLVAFVLGGILLVRLGLSDNRMAAVRLGAFLLGCGGIVKNEGIAVVAAALISVFAVSRGRYGRVVHMWPAAVIPATWFLPRAIHGLSTDLASAGMFERLLSRLAHPAEVLVPITNTWVGHPMLWSGVALALALGLRKVIREERFVMFVVALQFAAYLGAYLVSPHSLDWHVRWSWERLVSHIAPTLVSVAIVVTASQLAGKPAAGVPEVELD